MKNLHVLPTDKPSNLFKDIKNKLMFNKDWIEIPIGRVNQNIYVTSDEEIKGGDYYYDYFIKQIGIANNKHIGNDCKKIILTTDQDLIKDGVQAIDDEFLEWFVKNPSSESVEIEKEQYYTFVGMKKYPMIPNYKIIIPKEEAKQDLEKEMFELEQELDIPSHLRWHNSKPKQEISARLQNSLIQFNLSIEEALELEDWKLKTIGFGNKSIIEINSLKPKQEKDYSALLQPVGTKQETLEEVAEKHIPNRIRSTPFGDKFEWQPRKERNAFIKGVKYQQEQDKKMFSEEDMINRTQAVFELTNKGYSIDEIIEQFKKK